MMKKPKILIVDDEKDFCYILKRNLESTGKFKVLTAYNGKSCLKLARRKYPNVIILDILMPGMDGMEVLSRLKKDPMLYDIPVIILSATGTPERKEAASGWFAADYLTKPVCLKDIVNSIEKAIYFH